MNFRRKSGEKGTATSSDMSGLATGAIGGVIAASLLAQKGPKGDPGADGADAPEAPFVFIGCAELGNVGLGAPSFKRTLLHLPGGSDPNTLDVVLTFIATGGWPNAADQRTLELHRVTAAGVDTLLGSVSLGAAPYIAGSSQSIAVGSVAMAAGDTLYGIITAGGPLAAEFTDGNQALQLMGQVA